ncbi:hypothetical protein ACTFIW_000956 [Dictyostelium discoideum]
MFQTVIQSAFINQPELHKWAMVISKISRTFKVSLLYNSLDSPDNPVGCTLATTRAKEDVQVMCAGATLKKGNKIIKTWSFQWSTTQSNMSPNRREMLALLMAYQALWWSDTGPISSVRTTLETMPQEESELDWRAYSRILQYGSVRISPEPSNVQKLNNQNECTPSRLESMETMSGLPTIHSFAFYPGEDELIQFEEGFYNTDLPNLEISNLVSEDSNNRANTNPNSTTLETGDYSTFQSHVMSIIRIQKSSTAELLMKSLEPSTLKVYSSSYTRFRNFSFSTINGHRSMLNQLLLLKNQTDIVNDPFITRIMIGIHKLRTSSAKYQEIWDENLCPVRHLSTYLRASKGRRKPHSGDSVFIQNEGKPLDVKEINIVVLSTLSSSGIDISKFKSHSTRSAMASLLLSNNVPFHVFKKMGRWKSNDTVDTFYEKRIIGEKSGGFLNTAAPERSESNYSYPIMLLKKRNSWRVVHHYCLLNKVTDYKKWFI